MLRRFFFVFFILTDDLIIQSFQRSHFGPTSFFNLSHSKTTEPQINKWDFISFFKSSRGGKNDNNNSQTFWHFLAKSCSNCCPHTLSVFFSWQAARDSRVWFQLTRNDVWCDAVSPLPTSSTPSSFTRQLISLRASLYLTCAWQFGQVFKSRAALKCEAVKMNCTVKNQTDIQKRDRETALFD